MLIFYNHKINLMSASTWKPENSKNSRDADKFMQFTQNESHKTQLNVENYLLVVCKMLYLKLSDRMSVKRSPDSDRINMNTHERGTKEKMNNEKKSYVWITLEMCWGALVIFCYIESGLLISRSRGWSIEIWQYFWKNVPCFRMNNEYKN